MHLNPDSDHPLILFDGVCNLCQRSVQLVIRNDRDAQFRFASLQSDAAAEILEDYDDRHAELSSVLLVLDGRIYRKSRAALQIARRMDGAWPLFFYLFCWIPPFLADPIYDFIGNRRYKWFGKKESCWIPDADLSERFLDRGLLARGRDREPEGRHELPLR